MATAVVATRPAQALRQRRESQRPTRSLARGPAVENGDFVAPKEAPARPYGLYSPAAESRGAFADAPAVVDTPYILRKFSGKPPSLIVHLHSTFFRLDQQEDSFPYKSPMGFLIKHIKEGTIPHDILEELYSANVPFYDGGSHFAFPPALRGVHH